MATEETVQPVAEEPVADSPPEAPAADKPEEAAGEENKEAAPKKTKAKKPAAPRKPRPATTHPSYFEMVGDAITSLKEKSGSSQYAITKFLEDKHKDRLPSNFKKLLLVQLRNLTANGKLIKVKGSYKLSSAAKAKESKPSGTKKPALLRQSLRRPLP